MGFIVVVGEAEGDDTAVVLIEVEVDREEESEADPAAEEGEELEEVGPRAAEPVVCGAFVEEAVFSGECVELEAEEAVGVAVE